MMPRRRAIVTASVRSLTWSFERIFRTCILTVSSAIESSPAISLLRFPAAISDNTSSFARADRLVSHVLGQLLGHASREAPLSGVDAANDVQ